MKYMPFSVQKCYSHAILSDYCLLVVVVLVELAAINYLLRNPNKRLMICTSFLNYCSIVYEKGLMLLSDWNHGSMVGWCKNHPLDPVSIGTTTCKAYLKFKFQGREPVWRCQKLRWVSYVGLKSKAIECITIA
jgi:hypothetical protein